MKKKTRRHKATNAIADNPSAGPRVRGVRAVDDRERLHVIGALLDRGASVKVIETAMIDHTQFLHRLR